MATNDNSKALLATPIKSEIGQGAIVDGYLDEVGKIRYSQTSVAFMLRDEKTWLNGLAKNAPEYFELLKQNGYSGEFARLIISRPGKRGATIVLGLSREDVEILVKLEAMRGNQKAIAILTGVTNSKVKQVQRRLEKEVQLKLQQQLGGSIEVPTPAGNIDLLTSTEIIEIKTAKDWKCALGQVLVYAKYYPSHQKRVHLFGDCHESYLAIVQDHLSLFDVNVTWESSF